MVKIFECHTNVIMNRCLINLTKTRAAYRHYSELHTTSRRAWKRFALMYRMASNPQSPVSVSIQKHNNIYISSKAKINRSLYRRLSHKTQSELHIHTWLHQNLCVCAHRQRIVATFVCERKIKQACA